MNDDLAKIRIAGREIPLRPERTLARLAYEWSYRLRNRARWADERAARENQDEDCLHALRDDMKVSPNDLAAIAGAGAVEVVVEARTGGATTTIESVAAAREMPWEFIVAGGTRRIRSTRALTVCRHLERPGAPSPSRLPERALYVQMAPGPLSSVFSFGAERKLVQRFSSRVSVATLINPTAAELEAKIRQHQPDIIHVTGVDAHQGLDLIGRTADTPDEDGLLVTPDPSAYDSLRSSGVELLDPARAAAIFCAGNQKPQLIVFNVYHSAGRLAAMAVDKGAAAALGFQDEIDDAVAEDFITAMYSSLADKWQIHHAFRSAWEQTRSSSPLLLGTGIVLWSERSMFAPPAAEAPVTASVAHPSAAQSIESLAKQAPSVDRAADATSARARPRRGRSKATGEAVPGVAPEALPVEPMPPSAPPQVLVSEPPYAEIQHIENLNYSMLHNGRDLFKSFRLRNIGNPPVRVELTVRLGTGPDSGEYQRSFLMEKPIEELRDQIRVPLISNLGRTIRESMRTGLFVNVKFDGQTRHQETYPVTLLPIDEWKDDEDNRHWLPSFVLPRDPAIAKIIDLAQRYLMALTDDPRAGFDGYQSVDPNDPLSARGVDLQAQAIWAALLYELPLSYINPPPTFTTASQRLRSPSDIVAGKRGTCIDLALLFAACLEYIDIYPVVVLLQGHAFPGYWRTEEAHAAFLKSSPPEPVSATPANTTPTPMSSTVPRPTTVRNAWHFDQLDHYREIVQRVQDGDLAMLETVFLTKRSGFADARDAGEENLREPQEFQSMMDIKLARNGRVTPLPVG